MGRPPRPAQPLDCAAGCGSTPVLGGRLDAKARNGWLARFSAPASVVAGQVAQSIASFITGIALGRFASPDEFGVFALGYSFCFLAISLGDTLIATPYTYFKSRRDGPLESLFMIALLGVLGLSLGVSALFWSLLYWGDGALAELWAVLPVAILVVTVREFLRRHFYVVGQLRAAWRFDGLSACLQLAWVAVFIGVGQWSARLAFVAIILAALMPLPYALLRQVKEPIVVSRAGLHWLRAFLDYGRWLVAGGLCHVASVQLYPWLVLLGGGEPQVGLYAACLALTSLINPLLIGLTNYFRPAFVQRYLADPQGNFLAYTARRGLGFGVPAVGFAIVAWVWGGELLTLVYGEAYAAAGMALTLMSVAVLGIALSAPLQLALLAVRAPVTNLYYHGTALLLSLGLALFFRGHLTLEVLAGMYAGVNLVALLVLFLLFFRLLGPVSFR